MWCLIFCAVPVAPRPGFLRRLAGADRVIAADGGAEACLACGLTPDLLLGDLDSIAPAVMATLIARGVPIATFPVDKDATDCELALRQALAWGARRITLLGALGGERLDHALANVFLLAHPMLGGVDVTLLDNRHEVKLLRDDETWTWTAAPGEEIVSLLPLGGVAEGVSTAGLRWSLRDAVLAPAETRAVSNEVVATQASVALKSGRLLVTRSLPHGVHDWDEAEPVVARE